MGCWLRQLRRQYVAPVLEDMDHLWGCGGSEEEIRGWNVQVYVISLGEVLVLGHEDPVTATELNIIHF